MPMLLALGAVHQRLLQTGLRTLVDLVVEAGDAWDVHHLAALDRLRRGRGLPVAGLAVHPRARAKTMLGSEYPDAATAEHNYLKAADKGVLKIMSKMGISTVSSYRGGQIFECLGLDDAVVERVLHRHPEPHRRTRLRGSGAARPRAPRGWRSESARRRRSCPTTARCGSAAKASATPGSRPSCARCTRAIANGQPDAWDDYQRLTRPAEQPSALRDLLEILPAGEPVPLDEVEPWTTIVTRFVCTAMSLGALSPEAHETLAVGMNRMGARSNSGEGGEDPAVLRAAATTAIGRQQDQTGRFGALRRQRALPGPRRGDGDQDGPGQQARRRRPAAGAQGDRA